MSYGYPYRGQPSVVYRVPFTLGPAATYSTMTPVGFGSVDGTDADPGAMHAMDGTITNDPQGAPGSGADRLRMGATQTSRLEVEVRPCLSQRAARGARGRSPSSRSPIRSTRTSGGTCTSSCRPTRPAESRATRSATSTEPNPIVAGRRRVVHPGPAGPGGVVEDRGPGGAGRTGAPGDGSRRRFRRARAPRRTTGSASAPSTTATGPARTRSPS